MPFIFDIVIAVNTQYGLAHFSNFNIPHKNIFNNTAPVRVGFYANGPVEFRAVHFAVFDKNVFSTARYFASEHHATVAVFHVAIAYYNVFNRYVPPSPVVVPSRFECNAIVTGIEITIFDEHVFARLGIAPVVVCSEAVHMNVAYGNVFGKQRVDNPER